jgi:hypothetical protein
MAVSPLTLREREFEKYIWDHTQDPFQIGFDEPPQIPAVFIKEIEGIAQIIDQDELVAIKKIKDSIIKLKGEYEFKFFEFLLQICGLTRSKIITDLKSAANVSKQVSIPSSYKGLPESSAWPLAGKYLIKHLRPILTSIASKSMEASLLALNHATWPGWIRQERAKRSGHEAEGRIARLFEDVGIPFVPKEKSENPLCPDVQIKGESFDLVIPDLTDPKMCIKSTCHTSNIGQYGESKDALEIQEAQVALKKTPGTAKPLLVAFIDGLGFRSNRQGLQGVLRNADEFFQFRTLWKGVIIANSLLRKPLDFSLYLPNTSDFEGFLSKYKFSRILKAIPPGMHPIDAGDGKIYFL